MGFCPRTGELGPLWAVLHTGDIIRISPSLGVKPFYPLIPWIGVMAAGYGFGTVLLLERDVQRRVLFRAGLVDRAVHPASIGSIYMAIRNRGLHKIAHTFSLLSFLNCEKYPPSLLLPLDDLGTRHCGLCPGLTESPAG